MFKNRKTVRPELPKEYVFTLMIGGEEKLYKCLVTETEVVTYEGDVEHKHLKVTNPECREGVLQIDTVTKIYGDMIEFQLERFIPYIRLDGHWVMSDTTEQERLQEQVRIYRRQSLWEAITGAAFLLFMFGYRLFAGEYGNTWILSVFGIFFFSSAAIRVIRVKQELNAMEENRKEAELEQVNRQKKAVLEAGASEAEE